MNVKNTFSINCHSLFIMQSFLLTIILTAALFRYCIYPHMLYALCDVLHEYRYGTYNLWLDPKALI